MSFLRTFTGCIKSRWLQFRGRSHLGMLFYEFFLLWAWKKNWHNPSKYGIKLFLSSGLEMNLTQMSKSSQLEVGHHKFGWWEDAVKTPKSARILVLPVILVALVCVPLPTSGGLISLWPSDESNSANDKDKQSSTETKAEFFWYCNLACAWPQDRAISTIAIYSL